MFKKKPSSGPKVGNFLAAMCGEFEFLRLLDLTNLALHLCNFLIFAACPVKASQQTTQETSCWIQRLPTHQTGHIIGQAAGLQPASIHSSSSKWISASGWSRQTFRKVHVSQVQNIHTKTLGGWRKQGYSGQLQWFQTRQLHLIYHSLLKLDMNLYP